MIESLGPVNSEEPVTRYIFNRKHFNVDRKIVLGAVFLPYKKQEPSVMRVINLDEEAIWKLGEDDVRKSRPESIKARADFKVGNAALASLEVVATPVSHPRHASIINWAQEESEQNLQAGLLANQTTLVLKPL